MIKLSDYKIENDGSKIVTKKIQELINKTNKLIISKGIYNVGPLFLHSDMELIFEDGAMLVATIDESNYNTIKTRVAGIEMNWYPAILNVIDSTNVTISGKGIINGNGPYWYNKYWGNDTKGGMREYYDKEGVRFLCDYDCMRPRNLLVQNSNNINIFDITSKDSGFWNIHILYSNNVHIDKVIIDSGNLNSPSTDGIDIDSSYDVLVENVISSTNDDSICIKSGRDSDGMRVNIPCHDIEIRNSKILSGFGITLGSELSAGIYNINIHDIEYKNTDCGFRIKSSKARKGYIKNIKVNNLDMTNVKYLFHINLDWNKNYNKCEIPDTFKRHEDYYDVLTMDIDNTILNTDLDDIYISNVKSINTLDYNGVSRVFHIEGYDDNHIKNIYIDNINVDAVEYGYIVNIDNLDIKNSIINTKIKCNDDNNDYDSR